MANARNIHVDINENLTRDEILDKLSRLGGAVINFGEGGICSFQATNYGCTSINVVVTMPIMVPVEDPEKGTVYQENTYYDKFSIGTALRDGRQTLRIGPARKAKLPWSQMKNLSAFNDPRNWEDQIKINPDDKVRLQARKDVQPVILNKIKDVLELGSVIRRGKKDGRGSEEGFYGPVEPIIAGNKQFFQEAN